MPKNYNILDSDASVWAWFAKTKFSGDLQASKKFIYGWRFQWNQNGNRFKAGDLVFEQHKDDVWKFLVKGSTIAEIKKRFKISINHIKRVLIELADEERICRERDGKAYVYKQNRKRKNAAKNK